MGRRGEEKFAFFKTDGNVGGDFRAVYDLHMRLEALSKAIMFYDMDEVFNVLLSNAVKFLESKLDALFVTQASMTTATTVLAPDLTNTAFITDLVNAEAIIATVLVDLELVSLDPTYLLKNFKGITNEEVRISNRYYSQYGPEYPVENLEWSNDRLLNTCEEPLWKKILEGMVGVSTMEMG